MAIVMMMLRGLCWRRRCVVVVVVVSVCCAHFEPACGYVPKAYDVDVRPMLWSPFLEHGRTICRALTTDSWQCSVRKHMRGAWMVVGMGRAYIP